MTWAGVLDTVTSSGLLRAHGLGGRTDLPIDAQAAAIGAAVVVAVSFVLLLAAWPQSREGSGSTGRPLPRLTRFVDSRILTGSLRGLALVLTLLVIAVALLGPEESRFNLAPYALYVIFWVGLALASVLFGPIWQRLNPLRTVHTGLCRLAGRDFDEGLLRLSPRVGMWPAAGMLLVFVWLELVYPHREKPYVVGLYLTAYCVGTVLLALVFGRRWFKAGDGFEVYSRLFGSLAPLGRRSDGVLVLRPPLRSLAALPVVPGLAATVVVLIGSTGFDGLTRTAFWQRSVDPDSVVLGTAGLLFLVAVVGALYAAGAHLGARAAGLPAISAGSGPNRADLPGLFAHSLIPIALGYTVAHYFSFLLLEGQTAIALISDPFGLGWNLFGTVDREVNYLLVGPGLVGRVQLYAIIVGHVLALVAAHDRALFILRPKAARRSQYPLAAVMVGITLGGVLLLLSS